MYASARPAPLALLLADAGPAVGLGHISRCGAVGVALRCRGFRTRCLAHGLAGPLERDGLDWEPLDARDATTMAADTVIADGYRLPSLLLEEHARRAPLVVLHEHVPAPPGAALVVAAAGDPQTGSAAQLRGFRYAALRPCFWGLPEHRPRASAKRVLVTTGATDPEGAGAAFAEAVRAALPTARVRLIVGPYAQAVETPGVELVQAPDSLLGELLATDVCVTAGGQTLLEVAATGTPAVAVPLATNQRAQTERAATADAVWLAAGEDAACVACAVASLAEDASARERMSACGQALVDGYGALRIAYAIADLVGTGASGSL